MLLKGLVQIFFPPVCPSCGVFSEEIPCVRCLEKIPEIKKPVCKKCGKPVVVETDTCRECNPNKFLFASLRSYGLYEGVLKEMIHSFKYNGRFKLAEFLGVKMSPAVTLDADCLVTFVPVRRSKIASRGYNQSYLLARNIANAKGLEVVDCLRKIRKTKDQNTLDRTGRRTNIKGAFSVKAKYKALIKDKAVLLVDDVFTSGSTVNEVSKTLIKAGAKEVHVVTAARAISN